VIPPGRGTVVENEPSDRLGVDSVLQVLEIAGLGAFRSAAAEAEWVTADLDAGDAREFAAALGVDDDVREGQQIGDELIL
jgi:hypothetical protein